MISRRIIPTIKPLTKLQVTSKWISLRSFSTTQRTPRHYSNQFKAANLGDNLSNFDLFATMTKPDNNIEMISKDSIVFTNLKVIKSPNPKGEPLGALLLHNQILEINLKDCKLTNRVVVTLDDKIVEVVRMIHPKPELIVVGLGAKARMLSPETKDKFKDLGIKLEVGDTRNAVLNYDLLATERSPSLVGALIFPPNM
ncbi:unnamed protein product [Ambrosiozyma monospora]|uniref:Unnamed protein product n=1 Tax=Ambrosiozyma monospora TaxID=43982 RepID=A0ACB5SRJ3_AMBMO|nr:unnamed protein product [Ambrosiozyma monospora]